MHQNDATFATHLALMLRQGANTIETTETPTVEPTITLTPTETPTATPNVYVEMTVEPDGAYARVSREMSIADYWVVLLLFAILVSMWAFYVLDRLKGGQ